MKPREARAWRRGRLTASMECAQASLDVASRDADLLPDNRRTQLEQALELVVSLVRDTYEVSDA